MSEEDDEDYILELIRSDAARRRTQYSNLGVDAYRHARQRRELRPNIRFLRNTVQSVDWHNRTLLEREARESSNRSQEQETRKRDDVTPTAANTPSHYTTRKESHRCRSRHPEIQQQIDNTASNPPPQRSRQTTEHPPRSRNSPSINKTCQSGSSSSSSSSSSSNVEIGPMPVKGRGTVTAPR